MSAPLDGPRRAILQGVVIAAGAGVLVLELAAGRLLAPWFGMSLPVWTNVLAVVLGALAAGYALGGRLASRAASLGTLGGLLLGAGALAAAAGWGGPHLGAALLPAGADLEGLALVLQKGSLLATLLLFGPPMVLLGTVGPVAVGLLAEGGDAGRAAGRVLALSTLGSIAGTFLTTYALLPGPGTRATVAGTGAALALCGLVLVLANAGRGRAAAGVAAILAVGAAAAAPAGLFRPAAGDGARVLAEYDTAYQFVQVREVMDQGADDAPVPTRFLTMNEGVSTYHSVWRKDSVLTGGRYYDLYPVLPLLAGVKPGDPLDVLVLGFAAGTQARALRHFYGDDHRLRVDGAEIDPAVIRAGREHFGLPEGAPWLEVHALDARAFLDGAPPDRRWDLVLVDCYSQEYYLPFHLTTVEFFAKVKARLKPRGILAYNAFAYRPDDPLLAALVNATATAFGRAWRAQVPGYPNFVVLATARSGDLPLLRFSDEAAAAGARPTPLGVFAGKAEGREALALAARTFDDPLVFDPDPAIPLLTDDRAPVERLMDASMRDYDRARLGER